MRQVHLLIMCASALGACLDSPEDLPSPLLQLADPNIDPDSTKLEADPAFAPNVEQFTRDISYLAGYADGERISYWNVDGPNSSAIAPVYVLIDGNDERIDTDPIIDVIPGDGGYTPWWRIYFVKTTDSYAGENIWSRAAIEAGVELGLLEAPYPTERIVNCPVTIENLVIELGDNQTASPEPVWFRNRRVYWVRFTGEITLPVEINGDPVRELPSYPVYILQRINEAQPIYEFATQVDINGDGLLNDSNNIFAGGLSSDRYSPLWYVALVRTSADYLSIDTTSSVGLSAEDQFIRVNDNTIISSNVLEVTSFPDQLINCPIQETTGSL